MNAYTKLGLVQNELKAHKGQYNSFGKYHYRSAEDILEAAKPLCIKNGLILTISDEVQLIGDRYYIKSTARVSACDGESTVETVAFAREPSDKKGMDESQITGTASSYARKYALNGLFCIDDTKDADSDEYSNRTANTSVKNESKSDAKLSPAQIKRLYAIASAAGYSAESVKESCMKKYSVEPSSMSKAQYDEVCNIMQEIADKKNTKQ